MEDRTSWPLPDTGAPHVAHSAAKSASLGPDRNEISMQCQCRNIWRRTVTMFAMGAPHLSHGSAATNRSGVCHPINGVGHCRPKQRTLATQHLLEVDQQGIIIRSSGCHCPSFSQGKDLSLEPVLGHNQATHDEGFFCIELHNFLPALVTTVTANLCLSPARLAPVSPGASCLSFSCLPPASKLS